MSESARRRRGVWLVLYLAALALRLAQLPLPFGEIDLGWGGAFYGLIARNHLRHGFGVEHLAPILDASPLLLASPRLYLNHPPAIGWLVALSFAVFGEHEWSARLVPLAFSMGMLAVLHRWMREAHGPRTAWWAVFFAGISPMGTYYGPHVDVQGSLVLFALALLAWRLHRWAVDPSAANRRWLLAVLLGGLLTDWPAWYPLALLPPLVRGTLAKPRPPGLARALAWSGVGALLILSWIGFKGGLLPLIGEGMHRASNRRVDDPAVGGGFGWIGWLGRMAWIQMKLVGPLPWLGALGGLALRPPRIDPRRLAPILLWAVAIAHILIWRQGAWFHTYWSVYFLLPVSVAAASMFSRGAWSRPAARWMAGTAHALFSLGMWAHLLAQPNLADPFWRDFGRGVRERTPSEATVCLTEPMRAQFAYYADRRGLGGLTRPEQLDQPPYDACGWIAIPSFRLGDRAAVVERLDADWPSAEYATGDRYGRRWRLYGPRP